ncbi:rhodanese-like domain-containing protein [Desulfurispirillum indicum]
MQSAEDYAKGHILGTINIPGADFLNGDKRLLQLPKDKKITVTALPY